MELEQLQTNYLVLSDAGKPVYAFHGSDSAVTEYGAILQALVSWFERDKDKLSSFVADRTKFVVSVEHPLVLVAIDKTGQSEQQLKTNLDILHAQILSTLTRDQLVKAFASRPNLDLKAVLAGTEVFLHSLIKAMCQAYPGVWLGALESLMVKKRERDAIHSCFFSSRKQSLLYGLLLADARLVAVVRPKLHSLHPPDLFLLLSMIFNTTAFIEGEHWVPICLPKFNSRGFLYAYINFLTPTVAIVLVSPDRNAFFEMQSVAKEFVEKMGTDLQAQITSAALSPRPQPTELKASMITHFLYKSRTNMQYVQSSRHPHFDDAEKFQDLLRAYRSLQATMHAAGLRISHSKYEDHSMLGWVTAQFEFYCVGEARSQQELSNAVRHVISWIRSKEERLFVVDGVTF